MEIWTILAEIWIILAIIVASVLAAIAVIRVAMHAAYKRWYRAYAALPVRDKILYDSSLVRDLVKSNGLDLNKMSDATANHLNELIRSRDEWASLARRSSVTAMHNYGSLATFTSAGSDFRVVECERDILSFCEPYCSPD